jgi:hypothetical protein
VNRRWFLFGVLYGALSQRPQNHRPGLPKRDEPKTRPIPICRSHPTSQDPRVDGCHSCVVQQSMGHGIHDIHATLHVGYISGRLRLMQHAAARS